MYCASCGKSIPDESQFCLYCGTATKSNSVQTIVPSDELPVHIGEVGCAYDLPTEEDAGQARRGIIIWFSLLDNSRRPTRADGEVTVKISTGDNLFSDFKKSIQVRKEDFRQSTNKKNFYGYWFNTEKAVLTEQKPPYQMRRIELWFKTAPGKKLYGKGDAPF